MNRPLHIATLAPGHPSHSAGGAEVAALTLHRALQALDGVSALHLSPTPHGLARAMRLTAADPATAFLETGALDPLFLTNRDPACLDALVARLQAFAPDIIHCHHVLGFGADALFRLKRAFPDARLVLTLHEFIAICHRQGQMVTAPDGDLCESSAPERCHACFPDIAPARFMRRTAVLRALIGAVDALVAPSAFLAQRYIDWGLPADRIHVLENPIAGTAAPLETATPAPRNRFAFFGQLTPFKGIEVLLEAWALLQASGVEVTLDIHGGGLDRQPAEFRARMEASLARPPQGVRFHGPYANGAVASLMREIDWVVVPSTWWENSPVVIQEAFRARRPVIASNIGGMAEKVRDRVDGLHFDVGDPASLAARIADALHTPGLWQQLTAAITPAASTTETARRHLALYNALGAATRAAPNAA